MSRTGRHRNLRRLRLEQAYQLPGLSCQPPNLLDRTDLCCTERDSLKDKLVVYAFILLTVGLLGYAAFEPYLKQKIEVGTRTRQYTTSTNMAEQNVQGVRNYMPVVSSQGNS